MPSRSWSRLDFPRFRGHATRTLRALYLPNTAQAPRPCTGRARAAVSASPSAAPWSVWHSRDIRERRPNDHHYVAISRSGTGSLDL